ncbi:MAG: hypothetical protein ACM3ZQ_06425 [Bacillota bacterium]
MRKRSVRLAALAIVIVAALALTPFVRAEVKRLFGWYSYEVQPAPKPPATDGKGDGKQPQYSSTITWGRETSGTIDHQSTTTSLAEARKFLGESVVLPPAIDGQEMFLYREVDKDSKVVVIGLSAVSVKLPDLPTVGFWARYRPAGDHQINVTYGNDFKVRTEDRVINGHSARLVWVERVSGKVGPAELWIEDGKWVYEMREDRGQMDPLIKLAESLR